MAADTSAALGRRILTTYELVRPERMVVTKVDEAESMMPLLAAVHERGQPIMIVTDGRRVPEDIARAIPSLLTSALLRETPSSQETLS